jgi:hypothetical protein
MGTWKLVESKSKIAVGAGRAVTVVYSLNGENSKVTVDGVDPDGKPIHNEWTGKFDGKDYPVTGDPTTDTRSYKRINDHTLDLTDKKGKKIVATGEAVFDDKTGGVLIKSKDSRGKGFTSYFVYEKE